ncbi:protein kinase domain-containing protein [Actinomadura rupiterrae]|uniref:protein kinase domain-containing protein n=1 Tax=Actinomadura rupiterrae TaxID=559627 RepID=UPI0020A49D4B|nr:protein kinase [Actinomadura rupiterrae]MCP2339458.1 serine/threonine protein kinase [Actinomadura rupiterrae]
MAGRPLGPDDPVRVGAYRIESKIGEGGMGAVYLGRAPAEDGGDGRRVAVKVVRPELAGDPAFLARFHDEAVNAERVASFCTAQVLEHGRDLGLAYLVTEYIEGPSLLQHMNRSGPLSPGMLHGVAVGVAAALVAIHSSGLVHRDLKPSNVLLSITGPRVIDFGIARALDVAVSHTRTGQVVGTPGYIAPEQVLAHEVTPAVDVFAWGCLVAYAASGHNPFGQGSFEIMIARSLHGEPDLTALTTQPLAGLVRRALAKEPKHRPSAQELLLGLVGGASDAAVSTTLNEAWNEPVPPGPSGDVRMVPAPTPAPTPAGPGYTEDVPNEPPARPANGNTHPPTEAAAAHPQAAAAHQQSPPPLPAAFQQHGAQAPPAAAHQHGAQAPPAAAHQHGAPAPPANTGPGVIPWTEPGRHERPKSRRTPILVAAGVAAVVAAGGGGALLVNSMHGTKTNSSGTNGPYGPSGGPAAAANTAGLPGDAMLVRQDTAPGWPQSCHARIARYSTSMGSSVAGVTSGSCDMLPEYSPDHTKFAFTRKTGSGYEVWTANAAGGGEAKVTDKITGGRVAWSPDGRQLAYIGKDDNGVTQLYTIPASGGKAAQLTTDGYAKDDPAWSSTGYLAFWSKRSGAEQIYVIKPDRPEQWVQITNGTEPSVDPAWSPDGRRIVFTRGAYPSGQIWIAASNGANAQVLSRTGEHEMDPVWSRDGKWVAFTRGTYASPTVWAVRENGYDMRRISPQGSSLAHPAW